MHAVGATIVTLALLWTATTAVIAQEAEGAASRKERTVYLAGTFTHTSPTEVMIESEDPRLDGPYRVGPIGEAVDAATGIARMWGTGHAVREDGTFDGPFRGFSRSAGGGRSAYTVTAWLAGSGAYEGLTMSFVARFDGDEGLYDAIIFEGDPPPVE